MYRFKLSPSFVEGYKNRIVPWSPLGEFVFYRTYSRLIDGENRNERWWESDLRVVEGTYQIQKAHCDELKLPWNNAKAQHSAGIMFDKIFRFKFMPPGRGMWMMGSDFIKTRGGASLNNCFSGDTRIWTDRGLVTLRDIVDQTVKVLDGNGNWTSAKIISHGKQFLYKYDFTMGTRSNFKLSYRATADHRWILSDGSSTTALKVGDRVRIIPRENIKEDSKDFKEGFAHGIIFGDGTRHTYYKERHFIRLCGEKHLPYKELLEGIDGYVSTRPVKESEDLIITIVRKGENWKSLPSEDKSWDYQSGFVRGWAAADASLSKSGSLRLASTDKEALEWVIMRAPLVGYTATGICKDSSMETNYAVRTNSVWQLTLSKHSTEYICRSRTYAADFEEVYCPSVSTTQSFHLEGGLITGNCGFVSTGDIEIRGSFAFCWCMDMLMLGVGVGFDVKGAGKLVIQRPRDEGSIVYKIPDSREGWVKSVEYVLSAFFLGKELPYFDYSLIRPYGTPIKGFGGVASGPDPLQLLHNSIKALLSRREGQELSSVDIVDLFNFIGVCVVAGNVRRCLPKGTFVYTKVGVKEIQDILIGDLVRTSKGYSQVQEVINQGKQKIIKIKTELGEFRCTKNHKVAVLISFDSYEWKNAGELSLNDRLVYVLKGDFGNKTQLPENMFFKDFKATTGIDISIPELDVDVSWLLGMIAGDGYVYTNEKNNFASAYVCIALSKDYPDIIARCVRVFKKFGVIPQIVESEGKGIVVRVNSRMLSQYLSQFKKPKELLRVPTCIKNGVIEVREAYLAGLFDSDGSCRTRPLMLMGSVYEWFVDEIQSIYTSLGIPTRKVQERKNHEVWKDLWHLSAVGSYSVDLSQSFLRSYSSKFLFLNKTNRRSNDYTYPIEWRKDLGISKYVCGKSRGIPVSTVLKHGLKIGNLLPILVKGIEEGIEEETYDISVRDNPEFVAGMGLLVHNSAECALGEMWDAKYRLMKDPRLNLQELKSHRWASNNSIFAQVGKTDYRLIKDAIAQNGEPGIVWLENIQKYSRFCDPPDMKDMKAVGTNPCFEQTLESGELCNLSETYPSYHSNYQEYQETLKYAYLYSKTVTLVSTHWPETNAILLRNRRIGLSQSGIIDAFVRHGRSTMLQWCRDGYDYLKRLDQIYSDWLCIPLSLKRTSVKPSGTVSLIAGVSPGIHYPHSEYYIRRVSAPKDSPLIEAAKKAGYDLEEKNNDNKTMIVSFPMHEKYFDRCKRDVSIWEQMANVASYQKYWADNNVSVTVHFKKEEIDEIPRVLAAYEDQIKAVSFLPLDEHGYEQAPYEEITQEVYETMVGRVKPIDYSGIHESPIGEKYCDVLSCEVK